MIYLYIVILVATSLVVFNPAISLILGILFAVLNKKNEIIIPKDLGSKLLKTGIILLGGTISYSSFASISIDYFPLISIYVFAVITIGILLGSFMKIEKKHLLLLVSGTAICGGTAMAALAPIIQSKKEDLASSITIIFLLNLVAIIVFPIVGSALGLTQEQFGIFAALTIHDTASVIGTASIFGQPAMEVATILKLGRTLWIVPLLIFSSWYFNKKYSSVEYTNTKAIGIGRSFLSSISIPVIKADLLNDKNENTGPKTIKMKRINNNSPWSSGDNRSKGTPSRPYSMEG